METVSTRLPRVELLSHPKGLPDGFLEDRRSVYWDNNLAKKDYCSTTKPKLTRRLTELTQPKAMHREYIGDRPTPIWSIDPTILRATPSMRTTSLARPKTAHVDYHPPKPVMTAVPPAALRARASDRLGSLARHKTYPPLLIMENSVWDWGEWESQIPPSALTATTSGRVDELARNKQCHSQYKPPRNVQWQMERSTLSAMATERVKKLAQAKSRNEQHEDYDPNAWKVSKAAQHAQASQRLGELATPIARKCRAKKT